MDLKISSIEPEFEINNMEKPEKPETPQSAAKKSFRSTKVMKICLNSASKKKKSKKSKILETLETSTTEIEVFEDQDMFMDENQNFEVSSYKKGKKKSSLEPSESLISAKTDTEKKIEELPEQQGKLEFFKEYQIDDLFEPKIYGDDAKSERNNDNEQKLNQSFQIKSKSIKITKKSRKSLNNLEVPNNTPKVRKLSSEKSETSESSAQKDEIKLNANKESEFSSQSQLIEDPELKSLTIKAEVPLKSMKRDPEIAENNKLINENQEKLTKAEEIKKVSQKRPRIGPKFFRIKNSVIIEQNIKNEGEIIKSDPKIAANNEMIDENQGKLTNAEEIKKVLQKRPRIGPKFFKIRNSGIIEANIKKEEELMKIEPKFADFEEIITKIPEIKEESTSNTNKTTEVSTSSNAEVIKLKELKTETEESKFTESCTDTLETSVFNLSATSSYSNNLENPTKLNTDSNFSSVFTKNLNNTPETNSKPSKYGTLEQNLNSSGNSDEFNTTESSASENDPKLQRLSYDFESTLQQDLKKYKLHPKDLAIDECKLVLEDIMKRKRKHHEITENNDSACDLNTATTEVDENLPKKIKIDPKQSQIKSKKSKSITKSKSSTKSKVSKKSKRRAKNRHYLDRPGRLCCSFCNKKFHTTFILKLHLKMHTNDQSKQLKCEKCDYETDKQMYFNRHMTFHNKVVKLKNSVECRVCLKFMTSRSALRDHMRKFHADNVFTCDLCGSDHKLKHNFMRHMKDVHRVDFS